MSADILAWIIAGIAGFAGLALLGCAIMAALRLPSGEDDE